MTSRLRDAVAGITGLLRPSRANAPQGPIRQLTAEEVLAALPADAPAKLREEIQSGCCIHYTVSEGDCVSGGCGSGRCCYHIVSSCGGDYYQCLGYPCSHGNFSTGC